MIEPEKIMRIYNGGKHLFDLKFDHFSFSNTEYVFHFKGEIVAVVPSSYIVKRV